MSDITLLLHQIDEGDAHASEALLPLVYDELRRLAAAKLARESAAHTLQPTALVHEAWLRLGGEAQPSWQNRRHFLGAAAEAMRRILIDRARSRAALRHGGGLQRVTLAPGEDLPGTDFPDERLLALADALEKFALVSPERAELVKLRYFTGLTLEETAAALSIAVPTAKRWWTFARAWLLREMSGEAHEAAAKK